MELGVYSMHPQGNVGHLTMSSKDTGANVSLLKHGGSHSKKSDIQMG